MRKNKRKTPSTGLLKESKHHPFNPRAHRFCNGACHWDLLIRFGDDHVIGDGAGGDSKMLLQPSPVKHQLSPCVLALLLS